MEPNNFRTAVQCAQRGYRTRAYQLLSQVLREDPTYAPAWLWLSGVVDDPVRQRECLERVLYLDPQCAHARSGLAFLGDAEHGSTVIDRGPNPWKLGDYLVEYQFITLAQLHEALAEQQTYRYTGKTPPMLGQILLDRRWVTPHGLATALMLQQQEQLLGRYARPPMRLGEYLVTSGHITIERLASALARQLELRQQGTSVRLGTLLVREQYMKATVVEEMLLTQEKQRRHQHAA